MTEVKINLSPDYLREWYEHPLTKLILKELDERQNRETNNFLKSSLATDSDTVERRLFKIAGKTEVIQNINDFDWVKDTLLEDKVEWKAK